MAVIDKIIRSKTFYIVVSCIASVILWMYVASYENTTQSVTLTGLEVKYIGGEDILQDRNLLVTDKDVQDVTLTLLVKRSLVSQLTKDSVHVSVDLRDIRNSGEFDKVYTINYDNVDEEEVIVTRRSPEYMKVKIEKLDVNPEVVVRGVFDGTVAEGYMRDPIIYSPETIEVSGPESVISRIAYAKVVIDREELTRTVSGVVEFALVDSDGQTIESPDIKTSVSEIQYTIPIVKVKDVALTVNLLDGGGATENDAVVRIEPPTITVTGDAELLSSVNQLQLGTIDLASFAHNEYVAVDKALIKSQSPSACHIDGEIGMAVQSRNNTCIFVVDKHMELCFAWRFWIDIVWCHHGASCILRGAWHIHNRHTPIVASSGFGSRGFAGNGTTE